MSLGPRIFRTDKPTTRGGPILPMSREDQEFWRIVNERRLERAQVAAGGSAEMIQRAVEAVR